MECKKAVSLPLAERTKAGARGFAGEHYIDAILCADELFMCGHGHEDAAKSQPLKLTKFCTKTFNPLANHSIQVREKHALRCSARFDPLQCKRLP